MWESYPVENQLNISHIHSIFETKPDPNYSFAGEFHNFWECVYVISGSICASGDERVYHLSQGDIIFHKPMELHKYYVDGKMSAHLFIFSFSADGKILDFFRDKVFHLSCCNDALIENMLTFVREKANEHNITSYPLLFGKSSVFSHMLSTYIIQMMLSLYDDSDDISPISHSHEAAIFENAVVFMGNNIENSLSVADIAKHCKVSETKLKDIFNKFSSMGVHKYFLKLKLRAATELLKSGASVTETAEKLAFSSQGYFTSVCKRETGLCPTEIKNQSESLLI